MSVDLLREAAARMRTDAALCGDKPTDFIPAVADWLDAPGCDCPPHSCCDYRSCDYTCEPHMAARAVARAYLGTP